MSKSFDTKKLEEQNEKLAEEGYRVIAIANGKINSSDEYTEDNIKGLKFMGLVGFIDPIRKEAVSAIKKCSSAGIKVLMITGDHPKTAYKISKDLELTDTYDEVTTGDEVELTIDGVDGLLWLNMYADTEGNQVAIDTFSVNQITT